MILKKLKEAIIDKTLSLSNMGLTTKNVEEMIYVILKNKAEFSHISAIDLYGNKMDNIPNNFQQLHDFMEYSSYDYLDISNNPLDKATMDDIIYALQSKNSASSVSIHIFQDDIVTREQCQKFIFNSLVKELAKIDPDKNMYPFVVQETLHTTAMDLINTFASEVNEYSQDDVLIKIRCLSAKNTYDFNQAVLQMQIRQVIHDYYAVTPQQSSTNKSKKQFKVS